MKPSPACSDQSPVPERASLRDHPIGFWFFFWGEFAERCCYYGMRAILPLYMIDILRFDEGHASRVMSYFMASCYFLPLIGGYVADNYLGKYRTIVYFSIPYVIGQTILGIEALHKEVYLFPSLGLLAMGSGVIKPNISTLMGLTYDQKRPGRARLRSDAFAMFYGAINIGAAISMFAVPAIRNYYGGDSRAYAIAFLFPAALMVMAFLVFAAGKPFYAVETIKRVRLSPEDRRQRLVVLGRLYGLFLVVAVFWSIYDQSAFTWIYFARDHMDLKLFGLRISADQIQAVNPVLIVLLLPPVTMFWHFLANVGLNLKPTSKMLIGFFLTFVSMLIIAWAGFRGPALAVRGVPDVLAAMQGAGALPKGSIALSGTSEGSAHTSGGASDSSRAALAEAQKMVSASWRAAHAAWIAVTSEGEAQFRAASELVSAGPRVEAAAEATSKAVKAAQLAAKERPEARPEVNLADCSAAANRAKAAAFAANRAAEAIQAGNVEAARAQAAVAVLAAADAGILVAQARRQRLPEAVTEVQQAAARARISVWWQLIPYVIITMAEICISVVGLELAFAAAPAAMKSFVTACWLLAVFLGDLLNAQITPLYNSIVFGFHLAPGPYFAAFALVLVPVTLAFMAVARQFNRATAGTG
ncbi:MAG: POT-type proton-dependent oligopeptide transporter [Thermoguttaceae bacterium]